MSMTNGKSKALDVVELGDLNDKRTRFQVNKVNNENVGNGPVLHVLPAEDASSEEEDNVHSATETTRLNSDTDNRNVKSFRQLTREALPRLDNYRNIMSFQAANRPTLEELHNATLLNKTPTMTTVSFNGKLEDTSEGQVKFGWIQGVLVRCLLNIWGVMLFLRLSWVVAQTGVGYAILLILTTSTVTTITAVSMSAISTNGVIKGGGTYYMISRSLGPEFGGSIGLIFSLANAVACAMYVVGFCESMGDLLKSHELKIVGGVNDIRIIGSVTILLLTILVVFGMEWEAKAQLVLLAILLIAILDFVIGSIIGPTNDEDRAKGFIGYDLKVFKENLYADYRFSQGVDHSFFSVFAVFFPAATGILAGANISGDLKDPQSAIPKGTLLAILLTTASYILIAVISGFTVVRDATGNVTDYLAGNSTTCDPGQCRHGLHNSFQVIELVSWFGPIIYAGCFAATLSSALASLVSAPKVFQALCKDKLYPYIGWFGKGYGKNNEPVRGYILTFIIAVAFILIGELNMIAPLISNFFLAAYTLINFSTFHASLAKPVGWRPTFKYYNMWLSLLGSILCVVVMFLISWWTALITFSALLALYLIVSIRKPEVNWGSTTQAQTYKNALQAVYQLNAVEEHVKNYRPQILVLSGMPSARPALVDFSYLLTKNLSLLICGHINSSWLHQRIRNVLSFKARAWLKASKIKGFYMQIDGASFEEGATALLKACGIGKLKPNILLMGHKSDWQTCSRQDLDEYFNVLHNAFDLHMGVGILRMKQGFSSDKNSKLEEETNNTQTKYNSIESLRHNQSYSQLSQASCSSASNLSVLATPVLRKKERVSTTPAANEKENNKNYTEDSFGNQSKDNTLETIHNIGNGLQFQKRQKRGATIDVWWLYDDGGLTLLLPYIINTRRSWNSCRLRVFTLANKHDELECEHRNMASMLAKFRIDYSDLKIVPNITSKAKDSTQQLFKSLIYDYKNREDFTESQEAHIPESELLAMQEKTNRHLRLRELLLEHSTEASLVVMTLPIPRKNVISAPLYMAWLELLTRDMPPILLVRGNQTSVLTFYS
ncbi:bumetanide-sensitive sodium-(potassium)-chloride cotransporter [Photinus pyralis]|uniref:bumetanide-sensitive sodium-(potassium)-chloride cotransporter n=1 Tax=Photinus pyralis TaxID=7054 RepID=UPI0012672D46|nr:bumetanide-sensitive sodium-(potassium)-chloride cotransporter [Photinus pyralis]